MNKQRVAALLKTIGLYKPARKIYNKVTRYNKLTEIIIKNKTIKFWTPTFYLNDYVKGLAGEKEFLNNFLLRLNDKNTFWDIGANIGFYSIAASKKIVANTKIYAFEPELQTFKLLKKNIELNNIKNIIALPIALGDEIGEKIIYSSDTPNFGAHSFVQRTDYKLKKKGKNIKVNTADKLIEEKLVDIPDIIKIDVEGAEILVLRGMRNLLKNPKLKIILLEVHTNLLPLFNSSENEVKEIIQQENFHVDFSFNRKNQNQYVFVK